MKINKLTTDIVFETLWLEVFLMAAIFKWKDISINFELIFLFALIEVYHFGGII